MWQLLALTISLLVEVPIVVAIARRSQDDARLWRIAALAAAATLLSHPFAWMASVAWMDALPYAALFALVEVSVIAAEALFFRFVGGWPASAAIVASAVANLSSAAVGLVLWELV
jgi:hypothetical protein